jgi:microcin C transport system substrate-binding protein
LRYYTNINIITIFFAIFLLSGCTKKENSGSKLNTSPISIKKYDVKDGADPSVPAELGGEGFDGKGWETNKNTDTIRNEDVLKGGRISVLISEPPITLRPYGKDCNTEFNADCNRLMYESLLQVDHFTGDYFPLLATHWKISEDKRTFKFRINPDARWADGKPVTSEDFIATWKILTDEGILDPYINQLFKTFEEPVAESKYIVSIKSKIDGWRQFYYISAGVQVLPAHYIVGISGKEFLEKYEFKSIPGSGAYVILDKDINRGQSISLRRRSDYWGEKVKMNLNNNNFDVINIVFSAGDLIDYERFVKGEIDLMNVYKISDWYRKYDIPDVKRGLILKRRVFNESPKSVYGICINLKKEPYNDKNIRKALYYALDRKKIVGSLYYNEYKLMNSFFAGTVYENPENPNTGYNLDSAVMLLNKSGWIERNAEGYLVKNGKVFEVELPFKKGMDRYLTIYQEDLKKIGIKLILKEIDFATLFKLYEEKNFNLLPVNWTFPVIPNPENFFDLNENYKPDIEHKKVTNLLDKYYLESDINKRIQILKRIDSLIIENTEYILLWYSPSFHIAFHNYFKYPEYILSKEEGIESALYLWSYDKEKMERYNEAVKDEKIILDTGMCDSKFWLERQ